jgi:hypothetical protein
MSSFEQAWNAFHPGKQPVGYMLRESGTSNWVRFHSLPGSKRYAETDDERATLLSRQNALALEVLGRTPCWLVQVHWTVSPGEIDLAAQHDPFLATREEQLEFRFAFVVNDGEEDRSWRVHGAQIDWTAGRFDDLLTSIADDEAAPTLWMGSDGAIFAPYDGGVDLFLPETSAVDRLAACHSEWLSSHPQGL